MKHVSLLLLTTALTFGAAQAQNEMDAYKLSKNDLTGTARSVAMGGAFGALGGDISGVAINPAGIGVYRSSEVVTTLNFQNTNIETELNAGKVKDSKFKVNFDNLAFVGVFPLPYSDVVQSINLGFSYNRLKSFNRKYNMIGDNISYAMSDYMADRATGNGVPFSNINLDNNDYRSVWNSQDWLSVLGANGKVIQETSSGNYVPSSIDGNGNALPAYNDLYLEEKGYVSSYDFNIGTTFADFLSIGATLSVTDINYRLFSRYTEDYYSGSAHWGGYDMYNWMKTDGTGWQVTAGLIVKPIQELRIGVSYHSPTWYNMTDYYAAELEYEYQNGNKGFVSSYYNPSNDRAEDAIYDYKLRTPDKWTFSLAGVIGDKAIISADYELTNYKNNMKLFDDRGNALAGGTGDPNGYIEQDFRNASSVRVGLEYRITKQFSGRVGYSWVQSPVSTTLKDNPGQEVTTDSRAVTHYTLDGDTNYITYGLGYRFTPNVYTDIAFVMKSQKDDLYSHTGADKATLKTNTFQGLLTFGVRF